MYSQCDMYVYTCTEVSTIVSVTSICIHTLFDSTCDFSYVRVSICVCVCVCVCACVRVCEREREREYVCACVSSRIASHSTICYHAAQFHVYRCDVRTSRHRMQRVCVCVSCVCVSCTGSLPSNSASTE